MAHDGTGDDFNLARHRYRGVHCDVCGARLDDAMAHLDWHLRLDNALQVAHSHS